MNKNKKKKEPTFESVSSHDEKRQTNTKKRGGKVEEDKKAQTNPRF